MKVELQKDGGIVKAFDGDYKFWSEVAAVMVRNVTSIDVYTYSTAHSRPNLTVFECFPGGNIVQVDSLDEIS